MAKKQPLQSTFEFTGNTRVDGEHTYNQFIQRDNKGREISMASTNALYVHNVTLNEEVKLGDATTLDFLADHPERKYNIQTKLKDGRVFHGILSQVAPEKKEPTPAESQQPEESEEPKLDAAPDQSEEPEIVTVNSDDQATDEPSDEEPESADDLPEQPDEEGDEDGDDADEEPIQGSDVIIHDDLYTVQIGSNTIKAQGSAADVFNTAFDLLAREDVVHINRNGERLTSLFRKVDSGQYVMAHESTDDLNSEEETALNSISRRIITGQINARNRR